MSPFILGLEGPELTAAEEQLFRHLQPAGYVLFSRNIVSAAQTRALTDALRALHHEDPILALDQEGGRVTRTRHIAPALPAAPDLARTGDVTTIAQAACLTADLLRLLGFNFNFAPVLDLDHFPDKQNSLRGRCWGTDPQRVIDHAGTWNRWLRKRSVASCGKHFPACGRAEVDPHHDLPVSPVTLDELLATDIVPFTALMPELDAVMLAHVLLPALDTDLPASLSPRVIKDLLRGQLGFDHHLVLTDDLDMGAISERFPDNGDIIAALAAGNDLALVCHRSARAAEARQMLCRLDPYELEASERRITRFRKKLHGPLRWSQDAWERLGEEIAEFSATVPASADPSGVASSPVANY